MRSFFAFVFIAAVLLSSAPRHTVAAAPVNVLVCFTVQTSYLPAPMHGHFAVGYYAPLFKNTVFTTRIIGLWEGASTARGIASAFATNSSGCDIFIGPATSTFALALNALVGSMWIAYSATSTQLSDRVNYPLFSRTVPTDAKNVRGVVTMMVKFGWLQANCLCADTSNGQSLVQGVKDLYSASGGVLLSSDCMNPTSSLADVRLRVQKFLASTSRVVFVGVSPGDAIFQHFVAALSEPGVANKLAVFPSSGVCGAANGNAWAVIPGAICGMFAFDNQPLRDLRSAYLNRDLTADRRAFANMNWPVATNDLINIDAYSGFAIDGVRLTMYAMDAYVGQYGKKPATAATAVAWMRNQTIPDGVTGGVSLPTGDRNACDMGIFNTANNGTIFRLGNLSATGNLTTVGQVYVFGAWYPIGQVPAGTIAPPEAEATQPYWVIAVVLVPLLTLLAAAVYQLRASQALAARPLDATKPFAVMFVGIKNVADLHDLGDDLSAGVFTKVGGVIRKAARAHSCFEARRIDESTVMITSKRAEDALACAAAILEQCVMKLRWERIPQANGAAAVPVKDEKVSHADARDSSKRLAKTPSEGRLSHHRKFDQKSVRSSVRDGSSSTTHRTRSTQPQLQIGVHFGFGGIDFDEENNTVSYHGTAVERAAVVSDAAVGNQILVSRELINAMDEVGDADQAMSSVGHFRKNADDKEPGVMFVPLWMTDAFAAALENAAAKHQSTGERTSGQISAALQQAEAGLSMRRIAVACVEVPWLAEAHDAKDLQRIAQLCEELEDIAAQHRAEVQSVSDGCFVFTLNAGIPTSVPVIRAASIAVDCVQHCASLHYTATAGVAVGAAAAGRHSGRIATFGFISQRARAAQRYAKLAGVGVVLAESGYEEVAARFHVLTLGVMTLPSNGTLGRAVSIIDARDSNAEGEWLYAMGSGGSAVEHNEKAWEHVVRGLLPPIDLLDNPAPTDATALANTALEAAQKRMADLLKECTLDGALPLHAVHRFVEGRTKH